MKSANVEKSLCELRLKKFRKSHENNLCKLPPTTNALMLHTKRSVFQSCYLWRESVEDFDLPSPNEWGWIENDGMFFPRWLDGENGDTIFENFFTTCSCHVGKCKNCKCAKLKLSCLSLCKCGRKCVPS